MGDLSADRGGVCGGQAVVPLFPVGGGLRQEDAYVDVGVRCKEVGRLPLVGEHHGPDVVSVQLAFVQSAELLVERRRVDHDHHRSPVAARAQEEPAASVGRTGSRGRTGVPSGRSIRSQRRS